MAKPDVLQGHNFGKNEADVQAAWNDMVAKSVLPGTEPALVFDAAVKRGNTVTVYAHIAPDNKTDKSKDLTGTASTPQKGS